MLEERFKIEIFDIKLPRLRVRFMPGAGGNSDEQRAALRLPESMRCGNNDTRRARNRLRRAFGGLIFGSISR